MSCIVTKSAVCSRIEVNTAGGSGNLDFIMEVDKDAAGHSWL